MYESYTRQALPEKKYRELLGSALCVFNSNNAFIIENILRSDDLDKHSWRELVDLESGHLKRYVQDVITRKSNSDIESLFSNLVTMRNRIIHSYQITKDGKQMLATKEREKEGGNQFVITEEYLLDFISLNEKLSTMLHSFRGY